MSTAPIITFPAPNASAPFTKNVFGTYTITATGNPTPAWTEKGPLPTGVTFVDNGDGTATISGTPTSDGDFGISIIARNGVNPQAKQGLSINVPHHLPEIQSGNFLTAAASVTDNIINQVIVFARGTTPITFGVTGLPSGMTFDTTAGTISGHVTTPGRYILTLSATNVQGTDSSTFYLIITGAGSGPNGEFAYPDPSAAIGAAVGTWDGGGSTYIVPAGVDYDALGVSDLTIQNATFYAPYFDQVNYDYDEAGVKAIHDVKSVDSVNFVNVISYGANGGITGYHASNVGQAGWDLQSATNCTITNCQAWNTGGDGLTAEGNYTTGVGPTSNLTINGFTTYNAGRQGYTFAYCFNSTMNDLVEINSTEGSLDMEADVGVGNIGCSNVTFNRMIASNGPRMIESLQGPVTFNNCTFGSGPRLINNAALSGQPITFTNCNFTIARQYGGGLPPAGIWIRGPGNMTMNNCNVTRVAGTINITGLAWLVEQGGTLNLNNCNIVPPAGTTDVGQGSTVNITNGTVPVFTSANAITFIQGQSSTFTVTATGSPNPSITVNGTAPGLYFVYNSFAGTPTAPGVYTITITASSTAGTTTQTFTLTVLAPSTVPAFTNPATFTMIQGISSGLVLDVVGSPTPTVASSGTYPTGVSFVYGIAVAGTPTVSGTFNLTFTATNTAGSVAQNFTLVVLPSSGVGPSFVSANTVTFNENVPASFPVSIVGNPAPTLTSTGTLPTGISLAFNSLSGTPTSSGTFPLTLTATNAVGATSQSFILIVLAPTNSPVISSPNFLSIYQDSPSSFDVIALGTPEPSVSVTGTLPNGMTLASGTLSGVPLSSGTYPLTFVASNSAGTVSQSFTLTVFANPSQSMGEHWGVF